MQFYLLIAVCDNTQNLNETESNTFFDTKFVDTESDTFFSTKSFWYRIRYFFRYQIFQYQIQYFFIQNFFNTKNIEKFWHRYQIQIPNFTKQYLKQTNPRCQYQFFYRIQYFFRYRIWDFFNQFFIPKPIIFSMPKLFNTESNIGKVSNLRSFETELSHSGYEFWCNFATFLCKFALFRQNFVCM